jgi:thioredoxin reductase (NADPH)
MRRALSREADLRHPRLPAIEASELIDRLERAGAPFLAPRLSSRPCGDRAGRRAGAFELTTDAGDTVAARKAVVVAAGGGAFGPNRPPLDGFEAFEGKSVLLPTCAGARICAASGS